LTRTNRKILAAASAVSLVLCAGGRASALTIYQLKELISSNGHVTLQDLQLSGWSYDGDADHYTLHFAANFFPGWWQSGSGGAAAPVPEPSAALVFGIGLLAASRFARRSR